jgi:hypothetical protein
MASAGHAAKLVVVVDGGKGLALLYIRLRVVAEREQHALAYRHRVGTHRQRLRNAVAGSHRVMPLLERRMRGEHPRLGAL